MTWTLLVPAAGIVLALAAMAWSMHHLEVELAALRTSLRRTQATAVSALDLERHARSVAADAERIGHQARSRTATRRARRHARRR